jgi:mono/diheme cytochrome c family protein
MAAAQTRLIIKTVLLTLAATALLAALTGTAVLFSGIYNIASTSQHLQPVHTLLETGMHYSVRFHARKVLAPPLNDRQMVARGARLYHAHCVSCHGAPGVAQDGIGMSMQPVPGPLVDAASKWQGHEMYWIVRHGIKMSGMPAWEYRMADEELWQVVAFMQQLPMLSPADYASMTRAQP